MSLELYQINQLSDSFFGIPYQHTPTEYDKGKFFEVEYLYRQAGREFVFSWDSTPTDLVDEMDEDLVDDIMAVPSISEHVLTVGVGPPGEE